MDNILEVKNLAVSFKTIAGEVQAVRGVSFNLKKGETLAVLGESGCGKSVLCRSILRLLPENTCYKAGEIFLAEEDLLAVAEKRMNKIRGKRIAMIFQDPMTSLNPTLSIGYQIMEAVRLNTDLGPDEAKKRSLELMEMVGISQVEKRFNQYPYHFSGGMRQRTVIAIALASNPDILIADEPTTALDVTMQAQILELLKRLQKETGIALIFVTHDLGVVADIADRIAIMYAGRIVEMGLSEEIFYHPCHPYTWALLASLPTMDEKSSALAVLPGNPPDLLSPPKGDAFARRNRYALKIDYKQHPPFFKVSDTHKAATWLLHENAPKISPPIKVEKGKVIHCAV